MGKFLKWRPVQSVTGPNFLSTGQPVRVLSTGPYYAWFTKIGSPKGGIPGSKVSILGPVGTLAPGGKENLKFQASQAESFSRNFEF